MAGLSSEREPIPATVSRVIESRKHSRRLEEIQEQESLKFSDRVVGLIKTTVPDPHPIDEERWRRDIDSDRLWVEYPFESEGEVVPVRITSAGYPRDPEHTFAFYISIGEGDNFMISRERLWAGMGMEFDDKKLDELSGLLEAMETGVQLGEIQPRVISPLPQFRRSLGRSLPQEVTEAVVR